jgi:hypothetical protein
VTYIRSDPHGEAPIGRIVFVRIEETLEYDLVGALDD